MIGRRKALPLGSRVRHNDGRTGVINGRRFAVKTGLLIAYVVLWDNGSEDARTTNDQIERIPDHV